MPLYLELLHLCNEEGCKAAIQAIRQSLSASPDPEAEVAALLLESNWRPNVVGAVAMLVGATSPATIAALWQSWDQRSWLSPELAVTAFLCDPDFPRQAWSRIERVHRLERERSTYSPSSADAERRRGYTAKGLSTLVFLCRQVPETSDWLAPLLKTEPLQRFFNSDEDDGAGLAQSWLERIRPLLPRDAGVRR